MPRWISTVYDNRHEGTHHTIMYEGRIICVQSTSQLISFVAIMQNVIEIVLLYCIKELVWTLWHQVWVSYIYASNNAFKVGSHIFGHYTLEVCFSKLFWCAKSPRRLWRLKLEEACNICIPAFIRSIPAKRGLKLITSVVVELFMLFDPSGDMNDTL